jgi:MinD superfamily P-loop ATPase
MKQITVISGKGGTGKTSITAAIVTLEKEKVIADCDVDAPDLHLILHPEVKESGDFYGGVRAVKDDSKCINCGLCRQVCRFDAVDEKFNIDPFKCDGCGFCAYVCPTKAIEMKPNLSGHWYVSDTEYGPMVHAKLDIGEENSGKLVTVVRNKAKIIAEKENYPYVIVDGPPGIGCPVTSAITGVDAVLIITEPTVSGIHDMERVLSVARHFGTKPFAVINRYDLNKEMAEKIEEYCKKEGVPLLGKIPFNPVITDAMVNGKSVIQYAPDSEISRSIREMWEKMKASL